MCTALAPKTSISSQATHLLAVLAEGIYTVSQDFPSLRTALEPGTSMAQTSKLFLAFTVLYKEQNKV